MLLKRTIMEDSESTEDVCRMWTLTAAHRILPMCEILLNQVNGPNIKRGRKTQT